MGNTNFDMDFNPKDEVNSFPEVDLKFLISKEEVWENLLLQLDEPQMKTKRVSLISPRYRFAVAASLILLLGLAGFFRLYTRTISSPAGQHLTFYLPDSSLIELNAQSEIRYHPYWFRFSRTLALDGEAFFKVTSGIRFNVLSKRGETTVLGTSFNIYSRNNDYSVTCFTGKVRVVSAEKSERVLLNPDEQAFINKEGFLRFVQEINTQTAKSWRDNMFVFTGSSVIDVLQEIERQYNIKIILHGNPNLTYTGNFSKSLSEKEVLNLVCTPLGLKFEPTSNNEFLVD